MANETAFALYQYCCEIEKTEKIVSTVTLLRKINRLTYLNLDQLYIFFFKPFFWLGGFFKLDYI